MKKIILIGIAICFFGKAYSQSIYYDAFKLSKYSKISDSITKIVAKDPLQNDTIISIFHKYFPNIDTSSSTKQIGDSLRKNPFFENFTYSGVVREYGTAAKNVNLNSIFSSVGGLDVTNIVNGIADLMIERAKQEITIAFFNRFKKFASDPKHPEFQILFPKTTDNLNNLLSYNYPQMLPVLRTGFFDDLKQITYHLESLLELPKYQQLLNNFPEVGVALKSLQLIHGLEDSSLNAADLIDSFASISDWDNKNGSLAFKNMGSLLKLTSILSKSLRDTAQSNIWISAKAAKNLVSDTLLFKIYMGLVYQEILKAKISFYFAKDSLTPLETIFAKQQVNILFFQNKIAEFISLATNVSTTLANIKAKQNSNSTITNDDYYNYINVSLDAVDYAFSIVRTLDKKFEGNDYLAIARNSNNLYKDIYSQQYTQAISDALDILQQVHSLVENDTINKNKKTNLDSLLTFVQKAKPYAIFIANMAEAKSSDDVKAALENVILPVGSSSIKKNSSFNISVQSYLGAYWSVWNNSPSPLNIWSDKFGVAAPIGFSFNWGLNKGAKKNYGSLSLFAALFDIGAIVNYKLQEDSTFNGSPATVVSKSYSIQLGQIFSPGIYGVYGFFGNLPLSFGFGAQYGPGLAKIEAGGSTVVNNPSWRYNLFLAVDLPFFNIVNKSKSK